MPTVTDVFMFYNIRLLMHECLRLYFNVVSAWRGDGLNYFIKYSYTV